MKVGKRQGLTSKNQAKNEKYITGSYRMEMAYKRTKSCNLGKVDPRKVLRGNPGCFRIEKNLKEVFYESINTPSEQLMEKVQLLIEKNKIDFTKKNLKGKISFCKNYEFEGESFDKILYNFSSLLSFLILIGLILSLFGLYWDIRAGNKKFVEKIFIENFKISSFLVFLIICTFPLIISVLIRVRKKIGLYNRCKRAGSLVIKELINSRPTRSLYIDEINEILIKKNYTTKKELKIFKPLLQKVIFEKANIVELYFEEGSCSRKAWRILNS